METNAIVILYIGNEPDTYQCNLIAAKVAESLHIKDSVSISTMNQDDISKLLVKEKYSSVNIVEVEKPDNFKKEAGAAVTFVKSLFPNGISSERAAVECVTGSDAKRTSWINALEIISKYPAKKIHDAFGISLVTLKNLRTAYNTCAELAKIGE